MPEQMETHILLNAEDFGLKYFVATKTARSIFFVCITQEPKLLTGEVKSITEAYNYFNENFGNKAQPPVKIKQKWGWITMDIKQAESSDPNDPDDPSISEVIGKMGIKEIPSSYREITVFLKSLYQAIKRSMETAAKKLSITGVIKS